MKFGKTLYEKVSEEWHTYCIDYSGLTLVLEGDTSQQMTKIDPSEINKEEFFRVYELSKKGIESFYASREQWALEQMTALMRRVDDLRQTSISPMETGSERAARAAIEAFASELELLLGFLALNHTGFSKILKKFDKRTGSSLREAKLAELQQSHPFLDGGGDLGKMKGQIPGLTARLDRLIARRTRISKRAKTRDNRLILRTNHVLEQLKDGSVFFDPDGHESAPRTLADFPRFADHEIITGDVLGEGEFNTVSEVRQFLVSDHCHICFLHGGYNYNLTDHSTLATNATNIAANTSSAENNNNNNNNSNNNINEDRSISGSTSHNRSRVHIAPIDVGPPLPVPSTLSKAKSYDDNVSEYNDLDDSDHEEEENDNALSTTIPIVTRGFMKDHCLRNNAARYAIKRLRPDVVNGDDREFMEDAAIDLACEATFLAALAHPNIIKMRGTNGIAGHPKFGILLDRLYYTLTEQCEVWAGKELKMPSSFFFRRCKHKKMVKEWKENNWVDRIAAMYDVSRAMRHLHDHNIVFRDLKPDNVGIDIRGDIKIFDFGLAKEFKEKDRIDGTDQYRASGTTGTRRYMAPEVVQCRPYGLNIDVYSFAMCFWEVLALKIPFLDYDRDKHERLVAYGNKRPKIPSSWPTYLKSIIVDGWSPQPKKRGQFRDITSRLEIYLHTISVKYQSHSFDLLDKSLRSRGGRLSISSSTSDDEIDLKEGMEE